MYERVASVGVVEAPTSASELTVGSPSLWDRLNVM